MSANGEMFLRMREQDYNQILTEEQRSLFTYVERFGANEYETHKDDAHYIALYKEQKKAKDKLKEYLFNKRHNAKH